MLEGAVPPLGPAPVVAVPAAGTVVPAEGVVELAGAPVVVDLA